MKTKSKTSTENIKKTDKDILIENINFRNNQNYIINYKKLKKIYFSFNIHKEDDNILYQLLFIFLYLFGLYIIILIGKILLYFGSEDFLAGYLILFYLIILPFYLGINGYSQFLYLLKSEKYIALKKVPYNNYFKYKNINLIGIDKTKYLNNELIVLKK